MVLGRTGGRHTASWRCIDDTKPRTAAGWERATGSAAGNRGGKCAKAIAPPPARRPPRPGSAAADRARTGELRPRATSTASSMGNDRVAARSGSTLLIFNPQAELVQRLAMSVAASPVAQIPRGTWHSGVALASETLVLEVKPWALPTERVRPVGSRGRRAREQLVCALGRGREPGEQMALPRSLTAVARAIAWPASLPGVAAHSGVPTGAGAGSQQYGKNSQTPAMPGGTPRPKRR